MCWDVLHFHCFRLVFEMKIYVGGLPYGATEEQLTQIFSQYGEVASAKIIMDRETNRSKGFGFVEMNDDEAAKNAIAELHEAELDGRTLTVNEARPMEPRAGGGGGGRGGYGGGGGRGGGGGGYGGGGRGGGGGGYGGGGGGGNRGGGGGGGRSW